LITYGGKFRFLTPGVGWVLIKDEVGLGVAVDVAVAALAELCDIEAAEAEAASVAFVTLNPSG